MNKTKQFIAQQGSNSTVKLYDAGTGQLYRVITVGGNIVSQPLVTKSSTNKFTQIIVPTMC